MAVLLAAFLIGPTTASATYYGGWSGYQGWSNDWKENDRDKKDKDKDAEWPKKKWPKSDWEDDHGKKKCKYHKGCYKYQCKPPKDVPEPATALGLLSLGLVGVISGMRRFRR